MLNLTTFLFLLNAAAVISAALTDIFTRKIPNYFVALMLAASVCFWAMQAPKDLIYHMLSGLYAAMVGFVLFQRKVLGGGDVKMIAALATWFMPQQLVLFVMWVLICGGVLGAIYLSLIALRLLLERRLPKLPMPQIDPKAGMAYGLATACGFAISAWRVIV